jgi:hypothetical protein
LGVAAVKKGAAIKLYRDFDKDGRLMITTIKYGELIDNIWLIDD